MTRIGRPEFIMQLKMDISCVWKFWTVLMLTSVLKPLRVKRQCIWLQEKVSYVVSNMPGFKNIFAQNFLLSHSSYHISSYHFQINNLIITLWKIYVTENRGKMSSQARAWPLSRTSAHLSVCSLCGWIGSTTCGARGASSFLEHKLYRSNFKKLLKLSAWRC